MKKGFTLIELLAVIIILAIVALIATPIVLNVVKDAKKSAGESEANMILKGISDYCETEKLGFLQTTYCQNGETIKQNIDKIVDLGKVKKDSINITLDENKKVTNLTLNSNGKDYELYKGKMEIAFQIESKGFKDDSWETIQKIVKSGRTEKYYQLGDEKEVEITGYTNGSEKTFTVRIANMKTPAECSQTGFSQTACGFVVEFVDIIDKKAMNSSGSNKGGWPASEMYQFLNNEVDSVYTKLPLELQNVIVDTYKVSGHGKNDSVNFISKDKLYLLSPMEVYGENPNNWDTSATVTKQLEYYNYKSVNLLNNKNYVIKKFLESKIMWWLCSANSDNEYYFFIVSGSGSSNFYPPKSSIGVAPAFRIG